MNRRQVVIFLLIAFFVGALGSIFFTRIVFPYLSTVNGFEWVGKLQSNAPIVITKREEVRLNEGVNLIELTKQAQTVVVSIFHPATRAFLGNGLIITSDGTIFSTKEIVGLNEQVTIQTNDGSVYPGTVRALDPKSPIAVVSISARDLPVAQFLDSGNMQTAQRVFALGRTNLEFTREFASGLITKTLANNLDFQKVLSSDVFESSIVTDAHLNTGYIGGPVVNLQGLIIGMVTGPEGQILPSEAVNGAIKSYLETGKISRPFFGIKYVMITKNNAKVRGLSDGGAQISEISPNSAAAKAGILVNDLVIEANGQKVDSSSFEQLLVQNDKNQIRLLVRRGTENREITLTPELR
ncbi:MAG: S1C family serine protease [Candidatus Doudnabacteria bacterium]|nr:S1C family serine protease [Candidatus Doudnabacteria bacterium]